MIRLRVLCVPPSEETGSRFFLLLTRSTLRYDLFLSELLLLPPPSVRPNEIGLIYIHTAHCQNEIAGGGT